MGDLGSIPELGRSPGEGKGYPLQLSGLENSMDYIVHGVSKSQTRLSDFHFHFTFHPEKAIEKVMETIKSNHLDTKDVLYMHDGILLSHKKIKCCHLQHEPRDYHTK